MQKKLSSLAGFSGSSASHRALFIMLLVAVPVLALFLGDIQTDIQEENGILEMGQAACLMLAFLIQGRHALHSRKYFLDFFIHAGLSLVTYSFCLREIDIDQLGSGGEVWQRIEQFLRLVGVAGWLGLFVLLVPRLAACFAGRSDILAMPAVKLAILGGLFFVAGWPFDKEVFSPLSQAHSRLIEEILELEACLLFLVASFSGFAGAAAPRATQAEELRLSDK